MKTFAVVCFLEENKIDVIPAIWLTSPTETKWPNIRSTAIIEKYIRMCKPYEAEWNSLEIKIYSYSSKYIASAKIVLHERVLIFYFILMCSRFI